MAVALETSGYVSRLTGSTGPTARLLSMDAPFSLPRMFVAALFAAAALAAVAGAGALPGRRTWWLAVGLVGGVIAAVKAGSTVHAEALNALSAVVGGSPLSPSARRSRRSSSVRCGSSAGPSVVTGAACSASWRSTRWPLSVSRPSRPSRRTRTAGSNVATAATFVEESGEALAARRLPDGRARRCRASRGAPGQSGPSAARSTRRPSTCPSRSPAVRPLAATRAAEPPATRLAGNLGQRLPANSSAFCDSESVCR